MRTLTFLLALCATSAAAQQGLRAGDRPYEQTELAAMLADHAIEFYDGSVSRYRADGAYSYKYTETDRPYLGTYEVLGEGRVCVVFANDNLRCDTYVADGARMVLVIDNGTRFPVRDRRALVDGY